MMMTQASPNARYSARFSTTVHSHPYTASDLDETTPSFVSSLHLTFALAIFLQ